MQSILIVDDEISIRESLTGILQDEGFQPVSVESGERAIERVSEEKPDLVLLDIWMPGMDGMETLTKIRDIYPDQLVVIMSGHGTIETAVKATKLGAYDFIEKPLSLEKVLLSIQNAAKVGQLVEENRELKAKIGKEHEMVGNSKPIKDLKKQIKIAAPTSGWVLITGENGTGKELVARAIHQNSNRQACPFIEVNCAAIPEELIESELFGHEKGSFTGATTQRRGKFDQAHKGTLFLDEIGDMSLKTQAKVLRILQEHKFERVGGNKTIEVDVRVIAATNKDLEKEIADGRFREDLYYRLNVIPFHVPPLRERKADIPHLATHFLEYFCSKESRDTKVLDEEALQAIKNYSWPGNVRELKNLIERLVIMSPGNTITRNQLPQAVSDKKETLEKAQETHSFSAATFRSAKEEFEKEFLIQKLEENEWNISRTAEAIEVERSNLHRKIKSYKIDLKKG
ncbi:MAG: sigma-54-dependent Fis family transcriptional regulator [Deltaproteobacteria bacterium]|nr:MAG: sigma-54-dependent Fis family transcriptional regulator [Deltaproteobacteria bacterium]